MKNVLIYFFFFLTAFGCKHKTVQNDRHSINDTLTSFSEILSENDSLILYANLSVCESLRQEKIVFTNENDTIFIQVEIHDYFSGVSNQEKVPYFSSENDTLNFETLLTKQKSKNIQKTKINSIVYRLVHSCGDTLELYSKDLSNKIWVSGYHLNIMRQFYPNEKLYIPIEPPPPPLEFANEDSIKL